MESRNKEGKIYFPKVESFFTEEAPDSYRHINLVNTDTEFMPNGASKKYNYKTCFLNSHSKNINLNEMDLKSDALSILSNGMETERPLDLSDEIKVVEKAKKKTVKLKYIKGDNNNLEWLDENNLEYIFNTFLTSMNNELPSNNRKSCLVNLIEKEQLNIIRERSPTPHKERRESLIRQGSPLKRSRSNERISSIISVNGKEIHIIEKSVIELKNNEQPLSPNSKIKLSNLLPKKMFPIISNENSTIKLPNGCNFFFT